jgi:hypothetical protein
MSWLTRSLGAILWLMACRSPSLIWSQNVSARLPFLQKFIDITVDRFEVVRYGCVCGGDPATAIAVIAQPLCWKRNAAKTHEVSPHPPQ